MATITIRNLPEDLHAQLKERAKRNRRSLNQEVIAELSLAGERSETEEERVESARKRMREAGRRIDELRAGMTRFMTADEIDAAIEEARA